MRTNRFFTVTHNGNILYEYVWVRLRNDNMTHVTVKEESFTKSRFCLPITTKSVSPGGNYKKLI